MSRPLKAQDVLLALKLAAVSRRSPGAAWTQKMLAAETGFSEAEVSRALKRLERSHLYNAKDRRVRRAALRELLVSGLRYVFPAQRGSVGRGMRTSLAASSLASRMYEDTADSLVWATESVDSVPGHLIEPIHPKAPAAALNDPDLYEYLALSDALRVGSARERELAAAELAARLS